MKPEYKTAVHNQGFILWDWNVDSRDWKYRDSRYVNDVIQQVENLVAKNIPPVILMHDRTETINHLPELLNYLKNQGYTFKKLEQENMPVQFLAGLKNTIHVTDRMISISSGIILFLIGSFLKLCS